MTGKKGPELWETEAASVSVYECVTPVRKKKNIEQCLNKAFDNAWEELTSKVFILTELL